MSAHLSPEQVPGLRLLANVGEGLTKTVVDKWAAHVKLFNMYGPVECTIYAIIQRLELGEVEAQLQHLLPASTRLAAAVVSPKGDAQKKLVAVFIALPKGAADSSSPAGENQSRDRTMEVSPEDLETFRRTVQTVDAQLKTVLPSFMMPSAYVPLAALPVSTSGKTDRRQLRDLAASLTQDQLSEYLPSRIEDDQDARLDAAPPSTQEERLLHHLWTGMFKPARDLHVHDHFFRLGGDSLAAMQLVSLARQQGLVLTVEKIFQHPILKDLARVARPLPVLDRGAHHARAASAPIPPFSLLLSQHVARLRSQAVQQCGIDDSQIQDMYPVLSIQDRFMTGAFLGSIANQTLAACRQKVGPRDEQSQCVFALPPTLDLAAFEQAWAVVVARHPILRTRMIDTADHGVLQVVVNEAPCWHWSTDPLEQVVEQDRAHAMVFGDRLIRLTLVTLAHPATEENKARRFFILSICHAVYDGFSFGKSLGLTLEDSFMTNEVFYAMSSFMED